MLCPSGVGTHATFALENIPSATSEIGERERRTVLHLVVPLASRQSIPTAHPIADSCRSRSYPRAASTRQPLAQLDAGSTSPLALLCRPDDGPHRRDRRRPPRRRLGLAARDRRRSRLFVRRFVAGLRFEPAGKLSPASPAQGAAFDAPQRGQCAVGSHGSASGDAGAAKAALHRRSRWELAQDFMSWELEK